MTDLHKQESKKKLFTPTNLFITFVVSTILISSATIATELPQVASKNDLPPSSLAATQAIHSNPVPILLNYSPQPCVKQGTSFTISGKYLRPNTSAKEDLPFFLIMDIKGKQRALTTRVWSETKIIALLPKTMNKAKTAKITISSENDKQSKPLSISICAFEPNTETDLSIKDNLNIVDLENTEDSERLTTIESNSKSSDSSHKDQAKAKRAEPKKESEDMNRRLTSYHSDASLIGLGLPPLPVELKISQAKEKDTYVANELVAVSADMDNAKQLATFLSDYKIRVIRRKKMSSLGLVLSTFKLPAGEQVNDMVALLREQQPETWIDANHFYYSNNKPKIKNSINKNRATHFANIALAPIVHCDQNIRIGLLDGPVDVSVASLSSQSITQKQIFSRGKKAGSFKHATAIASLIVGSPETPAFTGAISNAELFIGVVMQQDPNDKKKSFTTTDNLILGLDWLLTQKVQVINLSLGGPRNALLEVVLSRVLKLDIGIVAAAGNGGGKFEQSYPAAQPGVIAVTAVDSVGIIARDSHQGDYIDLAAPGVDVWVPSIGSKGHYISGSSMASPLVAAALARLGGSPKQVELLFKAAKDVGKTGKDTKYGWGILQFPKCPILKEQK